MDARRNALQERHDAHTVGHPLQRLERRVSVVAGTNPAQPQTAAVGAVASIRRPNRAETPIQCRGSRLDGLVVSRDDPRWCALYAYRVPEGIDLHLVLQRRPGCGPRSVGSAGRRGTGRRQGARENETGRLRRIPGIDGPSQLPGGIIDDLLEIAVLLQDVLARKAEYVQLGLFGSRQGTGTRAARNEERALGAERGQAPRKPPETDGDRSRDQELPTCEHRAEQVVVVGGCPIRQGRTDIVHGWTPLKDAPRRRSC